MFRYLQMIPLAISTSPATFSLNTTPSFSSISEPNKALLTASSSLPLSFESPSCPLPHAYLLAVLQPTEAVLLARVCYSRPLGWQWGGGGGLPALGCLVEIGISPGVWWVLRVGLLREGCGRVGGCALWWWGGMVCGVWCLVLGVWCVVRAAWPVVLDALTTEQSASTATDGYGLNRSDILPGLGLVVVVGRW